MKKLISKTNIFVTLCLLFITLPTVAQEKVELNVGESRTLYFPSSITSKTLAGKPGCWSNWNSAVSVTASTYSSVTIKANETTGNSKAIVRVDYYYYVASGTFTYQLAGAYDYNVTVKSIKPTGVSVNPTTTTLGEGVSQVNIYATVSPSSAETSYSWSTSNRNVATVSGSGASAKINKVGPGNCYITVNTDNGYSASCYVTVNVPQVTVNSVSLNKTSTTLEVGKSEALSATVSPSNSSNKSVTWSSNDATVASISQSGVVSALKAGCATITATTQDGNKKATCAVTVNNAVVKPISISIQKSLSLVDGYSAF